MWVSMHMCICTCLHACTCGCVRECAGVQAIHSPRGLRAAVFFSHSRHSPALGLVLLGKQRTVNTELLKGELSDKMPDVGTRKLGGSGF